MAKKTKDTKNIKNTSNSKNQKSNKFDFDNEIVIGLARIEDESANKKKKNKNKSKNKNISNDKKKNNDNKNKVTKNNKTKQSRESKKIEKKIDKAIKKNEKNKTKAKKNNKKKSSNTYNRTVNNSISEQDIILPRRNDNEKVKRPKSKKFRAVKIVFLVLFIIVAIIATMMSPLFNIKEIIVEGNNKISDEEIISMSDIKEGQNLYRIGKIASKRMILENPYIKSVEIKRSIPDKVIIQVEERKATFMIEYGNGYLYINNQGYMLEISDTKLELPVIQGAMTEPEDFEVGKRLCVEDLEKMSTVIKIMEIAQSNDISELITRIDIENKQNYKIVFETEKKVAYLGDESDLNTKILSIKAILEREKAVAGEIFVNVDLKSGYPIFRQTV